MEQQKSGGKRVAASKMDTNKPCDSLADNSESDPAMECVITKMPDNVMLHILGFLSVRDICITACVCRRWNHLARSKPLWRHVDLSPFRINLVNIRKLVFAYFSDSLGSLRLKGFLQSIKNTECISDALLTELGKRCPNLKDLCIVQANLVGIKSSNLPPNLSTLRLLKCNYPTFWLTEASKQGRLDFVRHLDLSGSNGFGVRDVECLTPKPLSSLLTLRLDGCYRVGSQGTSRIASSCPDLQVLCLSGFRSDDAALENISKSLVQLKKLKLGECTDPGNRDLNLHNFAPLKKLEVLCLEHDVPIARVTFERINECLPSLRLFRIYRKKGDIPVEQLQKMKELNVKNQEEVYIMTVEIYPSGAFSMDYIDV